MILGEKKVLLNKMDFIKETEMVDLFKLELKDLLKKHECDPDKLAFIRGSAISYIQDIDPWLGEKSIEALLQAMATKI
jgi:elongation factor Tu